MSTLEFLRRIWPPSGLYVIARLTSKGWRHTVSETIEEAAQYAADYDKQCLPTYFAMAAYREPSVDGLKNGKPIKQIRVHRNVRAVKDFWLDIDVKPGVATAYESQEQALDALVEFCQVTELPVPIVIASGFGLQTHWPLTDEILPEVWKRTAEGLKALTVHVGLKADHACTSDPSRVLRPVGTFNRKLEGSPRPVELVADAPACNFSEFKSRVDAALKRAGLEAPKEAVSNVESATEGINQAFAIQHNFPPCSIVRVADRCAQVAGVRDTRGNVPEPWWYAFIQLACHSVEGDPLIHTWSQGCAGYSEDETNRKIEQVRSQNLGPTLCNTLASRNPGGCDGCPFQGKISSPAQLGAQAASAPAPPVTNNPIVLPAAVAISIAGESGRGFGSGFSSSPPAASAVLPAPVFTVSQENREHLAALALAMNAPTEDNVARFFEQTYSGQLRYCKAWGAWLCWTGTHWKPDHTELALNYARLLARDANPNGKTASARAAFARGVETLCRASRVFATEPADWDGDEFLLNTPAGTVDLRTGVMRAHNPADHITKITSVSPAAGPMPIFESFMQAITLGDNELIVYHQVSLGSILSGAIEGHWLLFWIGSGRNGKNTLGDLDMNILGDYAKVISTETLMSTKNNQHPTGVASLRGTRLAISSEVPEGAHWDESRIKQLTGDAKIAARLMGKDFFEFKRTHKHLIYGNHRPMLRIVDDAIRARMQVVPFKAVFDDAHGNCDPKMPAKLWAEAPQVLAWLIAGHLAWLANGSKLTSCAAVERETADYLTTQSTPDLWVTERCDVLEKDARLTKDLHKAGALYLDYEIWKRGRGEHAQSMTRWGEWMVGKFDRVNSDGWRYRGIRLKSSATEPNGTPSYCSPNTTKS